MELPGKPWTEISLTTEIMAKKGKISRFVFKARVSNTPMTEAEYERSLDLLARLIAQAYAADNPDLFRQEQNNKNQSKTREKENETENTKSKVA